MRKKTNEISERLRTLALVMMVILFSAVCRAETGSPMAVIKNVSQEVFNVLETYPVAGPPEFLPKRRAAIKDILDANFDSAVMAQLALGRHWKPLSGEERQEFSKLFYWRLYSFYILRIELYSDQTILYREENIKGEKATVSTKINGSKYPEFDINYRLLNSDKGWKIYDVLIEGVSLVANYRSQFNTFLSRKNTFSDLLQKLREKVPENELEVKN